jgi:LEA14-like dessication related protein
MNFEFRSAAIMKNIVVYFLAILFLSSCFTIKPVEFKRTENITTNRSDTAFEMTFDLAMYNPNNVSIRLSKLETEVTIDNLPLGKAGLSESVRLTRNSDFTLPVSARASLVDLLNLSGIGLNLYLGKQTATATIKGRMTLKKFIFRKKIQFEYKEMIDSKTLKGLF